MSKNFDFNSALPPNFRTINHNKTDHERYRREQAEIDENFADRTPDRLRSDRLANLRVWDQRVPPRWSGASISRLPDGPQNRFKEILAAQGHSAYITGREGSGKTYAGYAFIRRLVGRGAVLPSGVRVYSETTLIEYCRAGFAGRDALQAIADDNKTTAIMLDGIGFADDYTDRDAIAIERVIEKAYNENLPLIVTASIEPTSWVKRFSESTEVRLRELIKSNVVALPDREPSPSF